MVQDDSGLKKVFTLAWAYEAFQNLVGARKARRWLARHRWNLRGTEKVVDIGCGPGVVMEFIPEGTAYVGFDISPAYIRAAQARHGRRAAFIAGTADDFLGRRDPRLMGADLVLCNSLLHHLDDRQALSALRLAREILRPGGRLVCFENVLLVHQDRVSRWLILKDRGRHVRTEQGWKCLVGQVFPRFTTDIATGLIRIPYVHIIIECWNEPGG